MRPEVRGSKHHDVETGSRGVSEFPADGFSSYRSGTRCSYNERLPGDAPRLDGVGEPRDLGPVTHSGRDNAPRTERE